jgi:hypothetical protein
VSVDAVPQAGTTAGAPPLDVSRVVAEIEAEVRRKRATGELPADLERDLDLAFARCAPLGAVDGDLDQVLAKVEQALVIDTISPTTSSRPLVPQLKRVVRKAIAWHIRYVVDQVSELAAALARSLRILGDRVEALEAAAPGHPPELRAAAAAAMDVSPWHDLVVSLSAGAPGRVLHADCGTGTLVARLQDAGLDAYGVDPHDDLAPVAGLDVRADDAASHLSLLPPASLGGLVLSGCIDRLPVGRQLDLADRAVAALAPGAVLVLIGAAPAWWGRARTVVEADLSPGRPLHADTWVAVLGRRGLVDLAAHRGPEDGGLLPVPGAGPATDTLNANLVLINEALFGPATYAVTGRRPPAP